MFWRIGAGSLLEFEFDEEKEMYWNYIDIGKICLQENIMFEYVSDDMLVLFCFFFCQK